MFTVNFSWTSESVGRLSFRRREGRVDREGQARVCTRSTQEGESPVQRVQANGTGSHERGSSWSSSTFRTPARKIRTRSKRFLWYCVSSFTNSFGGNTSKIFEPIFFSFNFVRDCYERIIVNSNLGRKDFIFLIFFFFFWLSSNVLIINIRCMVDELEK